MKQTKMNVYTKLTEKKPWRRKGRLNEDGNEAEGRTRKFSQFGKCSTLLPSLDQAHYNYSLLHHHTDNIYESE